MGVVGRALPAGLYVVGWINGGQCQLYARFTLQGWCGVIQEYQKLAGSKRIQHINKKLRLIIVHRFPVFYLQIFKNIQPC